MKNISILASILAATVSIAQADPIQHGDLTLDHLRAFETPPTARAAGAYLSVTNEGGAGDALVGVEADFPRVEIHESYMTDGVMSMRPVEKIDIAPGETIDLLPGGMHVMFMGLGAPFVEGTKVPLRLIFENAGPVDIELPVFDATLRGKLTPDG